MHVGIDNVHYMHHPIKESNIRQSLVVLLLDICCYMDIELSSPDAILLHAFIISMQQCGPLDVHDEVSVIVDR